jgi:hypothetical protein
MDRQGAVVPDARTRMMYDADHVLSMAKSYRAKGLMPMHRLADQ